jgi:endonuclease G
MVQNRLNMFRKMNCILLLQIIIKGIVYLRIMKKPFVRLHIIFIMLLCNKVISLAANHSAKGSFYSLLFYADSIPEDTFHIYPIQDLEIPKIQSGDTIIRHTGFTLLYNEKHEQASWVAYELTKEETNSMYRRTNKFRTDPKVKTGTARDSDYKASGYDRGHLAPAADMGCSQITMAESFYFSNISPQVPEFNRGIWKQVEEKVRDWAIHNDGVYIVTGPVLRDSLPTISTIHLSVPEYYYKVILDYRKPDIKGIGFIIPNKGSALPMMNYAVSIDSVEKITGIDFFPLLPDIQEKWIEEKVCISCWEISIQADHH